MLTKIYDWSTFTILRGPGADLSTLEPLGTPRRWSTRWRCVGALRVDARERDDGMRGRGSNLLRV